MQFIILVGVILIHAYIVERKLNQVMKVMDQNVRGQNEVLISYLGKR